MQKTISFVSYLFWYCKREIFCLTEHLWSQGEDLNKNSFHEQDIVFKILDYSKFKHVLQIKSSLWK